MIEQRSSATRVGGASRAAAREGGESASVLERFRARHENTVLCVHE